MSRPPQFDVSLDLLERPSSLEDYTAGDAAIVRTIESRQHALVCGWGTPPHVVTLYSTSFLGGWSRQFLLRVPPYCTRMRVAVLGWQAWAGGLVLSVASYPATEAFTTRIDAVPTLSYWDEGTAEPASRGVPSKCLQVLAAPVASWSTVVVSATQGAVFGQTLALAFYPVLEQAV
jgi:hypothetical protein